MRLIDAHTHCQNDHPEALALMKDWDLKCVNIGVGRCDGGRWTVRNRRFREIALRHPERFAWITSFEVPGFENPRYAAECIAQLEADFRDGAVACKVWKCFGMEIRKPGGGLMMIDDDLLEPIFSYLEDAGKPLLMHIGEPMGCWQPLTPENNYFAFYSKFPQYHMHGKEGYPSHADLMRARDRVVERHPRLTVVGAHLASLEYNVDELDARFQAYPNLAVDTSGLARVADLGRQDRARVRQFFIDWQDRILFGSDGASLIDAAYGEGERAELWRAFRAAQETALRYYGTDEVLDVRGRAVQGLGLPPEVLDKMYRTNAPRLYPGV